MANMFALVSFCELCIDELLLLVEFSMLKPVRFDGLFELATDARQFAFDRDELDVWPSSGLFWAATAAEMLVSVVSAELEPVPILLIGLMAFMAAELM